jgi:hypothetical protein
VETSVDGVCCKTQHVVEGLAYDEESVALCCYGYKSSGVLVPILESIQSAGGSIDVPDLKDVILSTADGIQGAA